MSVDGLTSELPPARSALCCHCTRWTTAPVEVRHIERTSGPGVTLYVCPEHAPDMMPGPLAGELEAFA
ncbi:hypothetical protein [Streptomyces sp. NBC_00847]|uniref:hypothetical protein n=1 Tax=Streptomyces sp. NBC_00847 TaxID=2975850 RepID=UPI00224FAA75|nr:hypothetical protein [Streptomyces sp. NBC_00847]